MWTIAAYLSGSIPFGLLISRLHGRDVRREGSGNIGATNVGRVLGRKWGALCFVLDVLKGLIPVLAAGFHLGYAGRWNLRTDEAWHWLAVAAAAVLGHMFPPWLGFRGGKGVATSLGTLLGAWPLLTVPGLLAAATWAIVAGLSRYVSLASMTAAIALPLYILLLALLRRQPCRDLIPFLLVTGLLAILVLVRHQANIRRLITGTEPKIGQRHLTDPQKEKSPAA